MAVAKMFVGTKLRRLREERALTQAALAQGLGLSTSYVNQLENDQRPLTVAVLLRLTDTYDLLAHFFSADTDARLIADLGEVLGEYSEAADIGQAELDELVARMPTVGRTLIGLHRRLHAAQTELETYQAGAAPDQTENSGVVFPAMPFEEVRDFFYDRRNHIPELDRAAERTFEAQGLRVGELDSQLADLLLREHDVRVVIDNDDGEIGSRKRVFDSETQVLRIARRLDAGQRAFQMATQLAFLEHADRIDSILAHDNTLSEQSQPVARIGLANYFAGALLLPYEKFRSAAETERYDVDRLALRFQVGFETVCHRLSTLQRQRQRGVPFIFVRIDRAGNISKRQSATAFHFSRVGGSCPLWVAHEAFAQPDKVLTQVAQMPDGRTYLWIARTVRSASAGYLAPEKMFVVALGCDIAYADRLVYSTGIAIDDPTITVPIGAGCKVCDRPSCPQRAFPQLDRPVLVDERQSSDLPYPATIR
ncbi:short-chain fatty acyl-CoA regulator family protein [Williamsia sp. 1135]|uniref:short-chain fatty acyl-CoA regulator family protein n=1 Tax=Williamsia sp. 1135 TaxID=1889262 RepID=UPI00197CB93A|nr:short-chain fatty acyl-CoA regulator family protein [Williamsia sp. 1135]